MYVIDQSDLPATGLSRALVGADHQDTGVSLIFVTAPPGRGPSLHRHPYEELFIVQEGTATFVAGGAQREVRGGEIVIVPAGTPHRFHNSGDGVLRLTAIHVNRRFVTEWLDGEEPMNPHDDRGAAGSDGSPARGGGDP